MGLFRLNLLFFIRMSKVLVVFVRFWICCILDIFWFLIFILDISVWIFGKVIGLCFNMLVLNINLVSICLYLNSVRFFECLVVVGILFLFYEKLSVLNNVI